MFLIKLIFSLFLILNLLDELVSWLSVDHGLPAEFFVPKSMSDQLTNNEMSNINRGNVARLIDFFDDCIKDVKTFLLMLEYVFSTISWDSCLTSTMLGLRSHLFDCFELSFLDYIQESFTTLVRLHEELFATVSG